MLNGQVNLRDAIRRQIDFETGGKSYKLSENPAVLIVRYVELPPLLNYDADRMYIQSNRMAS